MGGGIMNKETLTIVVDNDSAVTYYVEDLPLSEQELNTLIKKGELAWVCPNGHTHLLKLVKGEK
jgi:hypothetical protein